MGGTPSLPPSPTTNMYILYTGPIFSGDGEPPPSLPHNEHVCFIYRTDIFWRWDPYDLYALTAMTCNMYSLVQVNWFSVVTGCTWVTCISDVREPISLHQAVCYTHRPYFPRPRKYRWLFSEPTYWPRRSRGQYGEGNNQAGIFEAEGNKSLIPGRIGRSPLTCPSPRKVQDKSVVPLRSERCNTSAGSP